MKLWAAPRDPHIAPRPEADGTAKRLELAERLCYAWARWRLQHKDAEGVEAIEDCWFEWRRAVRGDGVTK